MTVTRTGLESVCSLTSALTTMEDATRGFVLVIPYYPVSIRENHGDIPVLYISGQMPDNCTIPRKLHVSSRNSR